MADGFVLEIPEMVGIALSPQRKPQAATKAWPRGTRIISADSHMLEPDCWVDRFPEHLKDQAPRMEFKDGGYHFSLAGTPPFSIFISELIIYSGLLSGRAPSAQRNIVLIAAAAIFFKARSGESPASLAATDSAGGNMTVVTGPAGTDEFDHHPRFREEIGRGAIVLVARGSDDEVYAERIVSALKWPSVHVPFDFDGWWQDVALAVRAQFI